MRIFHLVPHFDNCGNGVVNAAIDLACSQARLGMEVTLAGAGEGSFRDLLEREGVTVHSLPSSSARPRLSYLFRVRKHFSEFKPDIVHAHMVPGAVISHLLRRSLQYKIVTSVHNSGRFGSRLMSLGDLVICVSNSLASEMRDRGVPSRKLRVVHNGPLESPRLSPVAVVGRDLHHPAIVTMAGLTRYKGLDDLISAFTLVADRVPNTHLYILGEGAERKRIEQFAQSTRYGERITFCGFVADPESYLKSADVFVLASHREGFGLALAEARKAGCAIVASDVGGIPEVLDGGSAGVLVPVRSPERLAAAVSELLSNPVKRDYFRLKAASNLGWLSCRRAAAETITVYDEALGREFADIRERIDGSNAVVPDLAGDHGVDPMRSISEGAVVTKPALNSVAAPTENSGLKRAEPPIA